MRRISRFPDRLFASTFVRAKTFPSIVSSHDKARNAHHSFISDKESPVAVFENLEWIDRQHRREADMIWKREATWRCFLFFSRNDEKISEINFHALGIFFHLAAKALGSWSGWWEITHGMWTRLCSEIPRARCVDSEGDGERDDGEFPLEPIDARLFDCKSKSSFFRCAWAFTVSNINTWIFGGLHRELNCEVRQLHASEDI